MTNEYIMSEQCPMDNKNNKKSPPIFYSPDPKGCRHVNSCSVVSIINMMRI